MALIFEWDPEKGRANLQKHGVSFEEASSIFGHPTSHHDSGPGAF